jgi:hypothetical protein
MIKTPDLTQKYLNSYPEVKIKARDCVKKYLG